MVKITIDFDEEINRLIDIHRAEQSMSNKEEAVIDLVKIALKTKEVKNGRGKSNN